MNNALVADGDKFMGVTLASGEREAELPVVQLPLDDIQVQLTDGRIVHVKQQPGGVIVQVNDLAGDLLAELPVPAQKPSLAAKAARARAAAERFATRLGDALKEAQEALEESEKDAATALPSVIELGPETRLH